MPDFEGAMLQAHLAEEAAKPIHGLHERANAFLHDYENPQRLRFATGLGVASIGQEVEGDYYRLTDCYNSGSYITRVVGLVAVEQVPDEAVVESRGERLADSRVGSRLWRLQSARIGYAGHGYDTTYAATIEDLAATPLERHEDHDNWGGPSHTTYHMPYRNFVNELEGEALERAQHVTAQLLDKLDVN